MDPLNLLLADFLSEDEMNVSVFPPEVFGVSHEFNQDDVKRLGEFNLIAHEKHKIIALPSLVPGMDGVFLAKTNVTFNENDVAVVRMFLEPAQAAHFDDDLHYQPLIDALPKV